MYEAQTCGDCKSVIYYPDEVVEGYWFTRKDDYDKERDVKVFVAVDEEDRAEATHAYCLDCAPCECGDHEKFVAHNGHNIILWQIACQPIWID